MLTSTDVLTSWHDLHERLERAASGLEQLAERAYTDFDAERIHNKAQGVKLALSYMREYGLHEPHTLAAVPHEPDCARRVAEVPCDCVGGQVFVVSP